MRYIYADNTDKGGKKAVNEDSLYLLDARAKGKPLLLAAVCDGVGGLDHGEFASAKMVRLLASWSRDTLPNLIGTGGIKLKETEEALRSIIKEANGKIFAASKNEEESKGSGTTICGLLLFEGTYLTVNVGDSRAYRIFEDGAEQLTRDQTLVQDRIDSGELTTEEAKKNRYRHILTQCVGALDNVVPVVNHGKYQAGDMFLVCSDGFYGLLDSSLRKRIVPEFNSTSSDLKTTCSACTYKAMQLGETDNISSILVKVLGNSDTGPDAPKT